MADNENTNGNGQSGSVIARLGAKASRYRSQNKTLLDKVAELEKANAALTKQNSELSERTDTKKLQETVASLKGQLRERDHKEVFRTTAKGLGAKDEALDDLWQLSGYRAETDVADPDEITSLITEQKTKRAYLFGESSAEQKKAPEPKPAVGSGKGGTSTTGVPIVNEQLAATDASYAMRNNARIVEAAKAKVAMRG